MTTFPPDLPVVQFLRVKTFGLSPVKVLWTWWRGGRRLRVIEPWQISLPIEVNQILPLGPEPHAVDVPAGFIFNGASIPRIFWTLLSPYTLLFLPAVVHDYAYQHHALVIDGKAMEVTRREADAIFYWIGITYNGLRPVHFVAWAMLALFGFMAWRR